MNITTIIATILTAAGALTAHADTTFTYQGHLSDNGTAVNGTADLSFMLFDASVDGNMVGPILDSLGHPVSQGLFSVGLDFGVMSFDGSPRWLEVVVNGTPLSPRQPYTAYSTHTRGIHVDASNRVGIATASPMTTLHVGGGIRARGGAPGPFGANHNGYAFAGSGGDDDSGLFSLQDGEVSIFTNSAERVTISGNGLTASDLTADTNVTAGIDVIANDDVFANDDVVVGDDLLIGGRIIFSDDGTDLSSGIQKVTFAPGSFDVSGNGSTTFDIPIVGARPDDGVIITPADYSLWPDHVVGYARVSSHNVVTFRIDSYTSQFRTYSPADWVITLIH